MDDFDFKSHPHRRFNPLTGEWVLVSPQRSQRPWSGQIEKPEQRSVPPYQPGCYLCPGNERISGIVNPNYADTFVFTNDFAALLPCSLPTIKSKSDELLLAEAEEGCCRVICYSPQHDLTLGRLPQEAIISVINTWINEYNNLSTTDGINYVQIFENRGEMMGCSNPHPHGQIWASGSIPTLPARESVEQKRYFGRHGRCLLCSYLEREEREEIRLLFRNESFSVFVPFWAVWPFETVLIPRFHASSISSLNSKQKTDLASIMIRLENAYDNLFNISFPYSMGIHQQPCGGGKYPEWHWHIHYYPPLLRSQSIKKHMVGYEMLAMAQRDITAEEAANHLRNLPQRHFMEEEKRV